MQLLLRSLVLVTFFTTFGRRSSAFRPTHNQQKNRVLRDASLHVLTNANIESFEPSSLLAAMPDVVDLPSSAPLPSQGMAGTAPYLLDYFRDGHFKYDEIAKSLNNLKNIDLRSINLSRLYPNIDEKMAPSVGDFFRALERQGLTADNLKSAIHFEENGVWYMTALIMIVITILGSGKSTEEARKAELAGKTTLEREAFAHQVDELSSTTAAFSRELMLLKEEMSSVRKELEAQRLVEKELLAETAKLKAILKEKDVTEKALKQQIKDLESQLKADRLMAKTASDPAPEKKTPAKVKIVAAPETPPMEEMGNFFPSVEEPIEELASTQQPPSPPKAKTPKKPKSTAARSTTKKKVTKVTEASKVTVKKSKQEAEEDWTKLSPSALKRKTVKALAEYLESKGVPTTSGGKVLKKADLLESVMAL